MAQTANCLNINQAGLQAFDGIATFSGRTITPGAGVAVTNGNGVSGNPTVSIIGGQPITGLTPDSGSSVTPDPSTGLIRFETVNPSGVVNPQLPSQGIAAHTFGACAINTAKWIVDPTAGVGTHQTITAATAAAASGETIFIRPGTYTENFTPKAGVSYVSYTDNMVSGHVVIVGKMSISAAGTYSFSGLSFQTNSDNILTITGSSAVSVQIFGCKINAANATALIANNSSSTIDLYDCIFVDASNNLLWNITSGNIDIRRSTSGSTSSGVSTIAAGNFFINGCDFTHPMSASGSTNVTISNSFVNCSQNAVPLAITGTVAATLSNSYFNGGSSSGISVGSGTTCTLTNCNVNSTNTNAVSGSGTLAYANLTLSGSSIVLQSTLTLTRLGIAQQGTFTPVVAGASSAGSASYSVQTGRYQVVGRLCYITINVSYSSHTGTGVITVTGLPFTAAAANVQNVLNMYSALTISTATTYQVLLPGSSSTISIYGTIVTSGTQVNSSLAANAAGTIDITGFYEI